MTTHWQVEGSGHPASATRQTSFLIPGNWEVTRAQKLSTFCCMPIIVGIDPGANETGVVVRQRNRLREAFLVERSKDMDPWQYAKHVVDQVAIYRNLPIAIEAVTPPNAYHDGRKAIIRPMPLIQTAAVLGAVIGWFDDVTVVDPGGHGSAPFNAYPEPIRPQQAGARGMDWRRHCRSAWDIAGAGAILRKR